jgi:Acetyltransferase (GNAT) domain
MNPAELRIVSTRGFDEVAELRGSWEALEGTSITTDFDYFRRVIESEPTMLEPLVLTVARGEDNEAMVAARVERGALPLKLGYKKILEPELRSLTVVYRGFRGSLDEEASEALVDGLTTVLGESDLDAVIFRRLDTLHPLYRAATTRPSFLARQHHTRAALCWERSLPTSFDAFMQSLSKSTRSGVKRYSNKLERDFDGRLRVRRFTETGELDDYFRDADAVAGMSYQRGLGVGVRDEESQRLRAQLSTERGWFRAYVLYVDEQPVAFCGGDAYAGRFYYAIPGYDPSYGEYRVGTYVLMRMIEDLCKDETVTVLDFGYGDAEYKRRFGDRSWHESDVLLFAPRIRPVSINVARTTILTTNDALARVAGSLGVAGKVKNRWRRHAAPGSTRD